MKRNLLRRVEECFPVEAPALRDRIIEDLKIYISDNAQAWLLQPDGRYQRVQRPENESVHSAQMILLEKMAKAF
jgi:polyphosphate kinase